MHFPLLNRPRKPAKLSSDPQELRLRADALFRAEPSRDLRAIIARHLEELPHYNLDAMDRVVSILSLRMAATTPVTRESRRASMRLERVLG